MLVSPVLRDHCSSFSTYGNLHVGIYLRTLSIPNSIPFRPNSDIHLSACDTPVPIPNIKLTDTNWPTMNNMPNSYLDIFEHTAISNTSMAAMLTL